MKATITLLLSLYSMSIFATPVTSMKLKKAEYVKSIEEQIDKAVIKQRSTEIIYDWYNARNNDFQKKLYELSNEAIQRNPKFPYQGDNFRVLLSSNKRHAVFVGGASSLPYSGPNLGLVTYDLDTDSFRTNIRHSLKYVGVLEDSQNEYSLLLATKDAYAGLEKIKIEDGENNYRSFFVINKTHQLYKYNVTEGTIEKISTNFDEEVSFNENTDYFSIPLCVNLDRLHTNKPIKCYGEDREWFEERLQTY